MRTIKFRGKRIDTGEWIYGSFHPTKKVMLCIASQQQIDDNNRSLIIMDGMSDWNLPVPVHYMEVIPESVGEFTGLQDKNGKDIYEGDVVKTLAHVCINKKELKEAKKNADLFIIPEYSMQEKYCSIDWYQGIRVSGWRLLGKDKRYQTQLKWSTIGNMKIEVIGNIFENPELIK